MWNSHSSCLKNINSHFQFVNFAAYSFTNFHVNSDAYNNINLFMSILMLTTISDRLSRTIILDAFIILHVFLCWELVIIFLTLFSDKFKLIPEPLQKDSMNCNAVLLNENI